MVRKTLFAVGVVAVVIAACGPDSGPTPVAPKPDPQCLDPGIPERSVVFVSPAEHTQWRANDCICINWAPSGWVTPPFVAFVEGWADGRHFIFVKEGLNQTTQLERLPACELMVLRVTLRDACDEIMSDVIEIGPIHPVVSREPQHRD